LTAIIVERDQLQEEVGAEQIKGEVISRTIGILGKS
jgi:hypothetical protein